VLTPVGEHELLLFWLQLVVLLGTARGFGALARRYGQPRVVGELAAGIVIGPSLFGRAFPELAGWLFPGDGVQSALLLAVAWLGIALLLLVTGFETDLQLLRRLGWPAASLSTGSLVVPLGLGIGLGWIMPTTLWGAEANRLGFALFIGVALSISALPVIAKIMTDMGLLRRNVGQLTIAAGMANDLVGWMLLGAVVGVFTAGRVDVAALGLTLLGVVAFIALSLTVGQRGVDLVLRRARVSGGFGAALAATIFLTFALGAVTQALGVEAVLGALVAGVVLGRSRYQRADVKRSIEVLSTEIFAPLFFATAGLYVDLAVLLEPEALLWAVIVIAVAAVGKLVGSYAGGRLSGLSSMESLAAGIGLNARGAMEIVLATIGLSLGALNDTSYAIVVLLAVSTSMAAPPLLRPVLRRLKAAPEEAERLEREQLLARSVLASARSALLPTRGGLNSAVAARALDALLEPDVRVTVLSVGAPGSSRASLHEATEPLAGRAREVHLTTDTPVSEAILAEAKLGHDLVALGLNDDYAGSHRLSEPVQRVIAATPVPLLLVRRGAGLRDAADLDGPLFRRVLLGITGTAPGRAAEELCFRLAVRYDAQVLALHVVTHELTGGGDSPAVERELARADAVGQAFGVASALAVRRGTVPADELVRAATEWQADTIVLGTTVRSHDGQPFLGHGSEWVLEHAQQTVMAVVLPIEGDER
jgi:Kef-type K+ transport system membrane component KefB/nucleotide-binding universal stress UspA family protein